MHNQVMSYFVPWITKITFHKARLYHVWLFNIQLIFYFMCFHDNSLQNIFFLGYQHQLALKKFHNPNTGEAVVVLS